MVDVDLGGIESEKSKMSRWQIGNGSLSVLEQVYSLDPFPGLDARRELAKQLNVSPRQVQVWFQNKRQRERKISRAKGQLSTPGLPDTPAQAAKSREPGPVRADRAAWRRAWRRGMLRAAYQAVRCRCRAQLAPPRLSACRRCRGVLAVARRCCSRLRQGSRRATRSSGYR